MNSSQKLIYIANLRLPTEKAYGIQIAQMCKAIASLGVGVTLIFPYRKNLFVKENIYSYYSVKNNFTTKRLWAPDFYFAGKLDKISFYIKNFISAVFLSFSVLFQRADFVYSRDELPLFLLSFFRKNLIYEAHRFSKSKKLFYWRFKNKNFKIIVITKHLKDEFIKIGFDPRSVLVAHDGVDFDQFNITQNKSDCRNRLNLPKDKKIVGYVGQLRTMGMEKGINILIEAYMALKNDFINLVVVIVGGNREDLLIYKNIAKQKKLSEEEILFIGRKNHREIPYYLKAFDVLVMPFPNTKHYAFYMSPLKLFEYMSSKKPIVASDLPSLREVLDERNAVLVEPDNYEAFAEGIAEIINQPKLAEELAENAVQKVKNFTWDKRAHKIIDFLGIECHNIT